MVERKNFSFYVAAKFDDKERARALVKRLTEAGGRLTADWTLHIPIKPYAENLGMAEKYAVEDMGGVTEADLFVLLVNPLVSSGVAVELGAAIAMSISQNGKPRVWVVGQDFNLNLFYFHPAVERLKDEDEVLKRVGQVWSNEENLH